MSYNFSSGTLTFESNEGPCLRVQVQEFSVEFSVELSEERFDHYSFVGGDRLVDRSVVLSSTVSFSGSGDVIPESLEMTTFKKVVCCRDDDSLAIVRVIRF